MKSLRHYMSAIFGIRLSQLHTRGNGSLKWVSENTYSVYPYSGIFWDCDDYIFIINIPQVLAYMPAPRIRHG